MFMKKASPLLLLLACARLAHGWTGTAPRPSARATRATIAAAGVDAPADDGLDALSTRS